MIHLELSFPRYAAIAALRNAAMAGIFAICAFGRADAEAVIIAALGDSLTAGYGLAPDQGLVPQLQAWLDANGAAAVVINAGVSGDTTAGGLSRLDWTLTDDVQALIVALGGNDMLRGLPPAEARANLDAILAGAALRGVPVLLVGLQAPGNYGPDYKAEFDAIYPELAKAHGAALFPDLFAPLRAGGTDPARLQRLMQPDGIHPGAEAVAMIVAQLGPDVRDLIAAAGGAAP